MEGSPGGHGLILCGFIQAMRFFGESRLAGYFSGRNSGIYPIKTKI